MTTLPSLYRSLRAVLAALAVATLGAAVTSFPSSTSADESRLPVPPEAEFSSFGDRLSINGRDARLHELRFAGSMDALLAYYRHQFGHTVSEPANTPGQRIVGGIIGNSYVTVQIFEGADRELDAPIHARVLQTLLQPQAPRSTRRPVVPMPIDSRLLSDVESQDGSRVAQPRVYGNRHSLDVNAAYVQRQFESRGLVPVEHGANDDATQMLRWFADDHGSEAMVSIHSAGDMQLVTVHTVTQLPAFEARP